MSSWNISQSKIFWQSTALKNMFWVISNNFIQELVSKLNALTNELSNPSPLLPAVLFRLVWKDSLMFSWPNFKIKIWIHDISRYVNASLGNSFSKLDNFYIYLIRNLKLLFKNILGWCNWQWCFIQYLSSIQ